MSDLYDLDAATRRVERAERAVTAQRIYIAKQMDPALKMRALANLETLESTLEIARKTHALISDVITQREDDAMAPIWDDTISKRIF